MQGSLSRVVLTDAQGNVNLSEAPAIPESFLTSLRAFDKDLFVLWAPLRRRYFIHQCVEHVPSGQPINNGHTQLCRSVYVVVCQDKEGDMVPLNDRVMNTLREMRANSEAFGGQTERGLSNYQRFTNTVDQELEAKREANIRESIAHSHRDNRSVWNKLWMLAERHLFTAPNK